MSLKLEVGKAYVAKNGEVIIITSKRGTYATGVWYVGRVDEDENAYPYISYEENGVPLMSELYRWELIKEVKNNDDTSDLCSILCSQESVAVKHDSAKPDLSLIPYSAEIAMAKAFQVGVSKYGRSNYKKGMEASRLIAAARRHLGEWFSNKEVDCPVDGQPHLGAAMACIAMIIELDNIAKLIDDRE